MKKSTKKIVIISVSVVLAIAIVVGIVLATRGGGDAVKVYYFDDIGMTDFWGDSKDCYGPISTDRIQTVFLTDTQTVTEVKVQEGDTVKKGDLLMRFDTTLSDLQLEKKRLEVEKLKLEVEDEKDQLQRIRNMRPMVIRPTEPEEPDENQGTALRGDFQISEQKKYDGSTQELALICWLRGDKAVDNTVLEAILAQAEKLQNADRPAPTEPTETDPTTEPSTEPTSDPTTEPTTEPVTDPTTEPTTEPTTAPTEATSTEPDTGGGDENSNPTPSSRPTPAEEEPDGPVEVNDCYVIIKVTQNNMSLTSPVVWQGLHVYRNGGSYAFSFFSASGNSDFTRVDDSSDDNNKNNSDDFGSGYTAAQLAQMRVEQEGKIKDAELKLKMSEAEYKIMEREVSDGNIYADFDGTVISLLTEDEAKNNNQPILKVSGGGGFYIDGYVGELDRESVTPGMEVTVNDWNTGMSYVGTVVSVGDMPSANSGYDGMSNPNSTSYPMRVFVDESADLQEGRYANITYSPGGDQTGVYLSNAFIRSDSTGSYVYAVGADEKLEKRYVTTGKDVWGSYTQILSGLTADDRLAFPYGKNVKAGAATEEGSMSDLYNY